MMDNLLNSQNKCKKQYEDIKFYQMLCGRSLKTLLVLVILKMGGSRITSN